MPIFRASNAEAICAGIADVERWRQFDGYGPIPGIAHARYEWKTETMVGSRIRVANRDGSHHLEEIIEWDPDRRVRIRLHDFSAPLDRLADSFVEEWIFEPAAGGTMVDRRFSLEPAHRAGWIVLLAIAPLLKRAVVRQLDQLRAQTGAPPA